MVKVNFAIHMEENILVLGKMGNMKIKCPNGDTYQGDFKNGSPSGKFIFTNSKGEISEVDFKRLKNPSMIKE